MKPQPLFLLALTAAAAGADGPTAGEQEPLLSFTPLLRAVRGDGDKDKFRENLWLNSDWAGGLEEFGLRQRAKSGWELTLSGRAIFPEEDYRLIFELRKPDAGFLRFGYSEYRKYFDDTGGFFKPFRTQSFDRGRDLRLDLGNIFAQIGFTRPGWPQWVVGYERQFKKGTKSMIEWGSVTETLPPSTTRKIYPALKEVDETVDIAKLDLTHTIGMVHFADQFRFERYRNLATRLDDAQRNLTTGASKDVTVEENFDHDAFSNAFTMDSFVGEKFYWSAGYLYTHLRGTARIGLDTVPFTGNFDKNWFSRAIRMDQDAHLLNFSSMAGPFRELTFYGGLQAEKTENEGFADAVLTEILPGMGAVSPQTLITSWRDRESLEESLGVRSTRIPWTTLYAEGRWTQQQIGLTEREEEDGSAVVDRWTDTHVFRQRYSVGLHTAPWRRVNVSAHYRRSFYQNDYNHRRDIEDGYSAFLTAQEFCTEEVSARISLRPHSRLSLALKYQWVATDFRTRHDPLAAPPTPAGAVLSGDYDAHIYNVSVTVSPLGRFYVAGQFSYFDTRTVAFANHVPSVTTHLGDVYTVLGSIGCVLDEKSELAGDYSFSHSNNFVNHSAHGLPLGKDYDQHGLMVTWKRRFGENIIAQLRYGFFVYHESSLGGANDYTAHLAAATLTVRF